MLNPFATVTNYGEMLAKIAAFTFFAGLLCVIYIQNSVPSLGVLFASTFSIDVAGVAVSWKTLVPALVLGLLSRVAKLHVLLDRLLGIRKSFAIRHILLPLALGSGASLTRSQVRSMMERGNLMNEVFYRYASSSEGKAQIDPHLIVKALDQWCWFWIVLESLLVALLASFVLFLYGSLRSAFWFMLAALVLVGLLRALLRLCSQYAWEQVDAILSDGPRRDEVAKVFNAIQA